jgi:hypothetical protein
MPVLGTYTGILTDYIITKTNGSWSISPAQAIATLIVTTDKGLNTGGVPYTQYSDTVSLSVSVSPVLVTTPLNPGSKCPTGVTYCVNVQIGSQVFPIALAPQTTSNGTIMTGSLNTQQVFLAPGSYTVSLITGDLTNGLSAGNSNYTLTKVIQPAGATAPNCNFIVTQEDAQITYTGPMYLNSTSSTMSVTATYTLQDATATGSGTIYDAWPGDITKANVTLTLTDSSLKTVGTCTPTLVAMPGEVGSNGLPSTATVSCTFTSVPVPGAYYLSAAPGTGSYYSFSAGDTGSITITTATGGTGFITGGGYQTATYLGTAGPSGSNKYSAAGLLKPAPGTKVNFGFEAKYQSNNRNLQGGMNLIIRSQCLSANTVFGYTPRPLPGGICVYQLKVPQGQLSSLSETLPPGSKYPYAQLVGNPNIYDVTWPTNIQQIANSKTATLLLQMYDVGDPGPGANVDPLSIQVTDSTYGLWFSNNWSGTNTVISLAGTTSPAAPVIQGGDLQVH